MCAVPARYPKRVQFGGSLITTYLLMVALGLIESFHVYWIPVLINSYYMLLVSSYMQGLRLGLRESAKMDGCGEFVIFWNYKIKRESITGWCSWWAYMRDFKAENLCALLRVWQEKNLADYGYRYIQIDDAYQGQHEADRKHCEEARCYLGGRPDTWLDWKVDCFPEGLSGYVRSVRRAGFDPALWLGCFCSDQELAQQHPDWFANDGIQALPAPWAGYLMDATKPETIEALIRPTFKGLKNAGITYTKIDLLRHFLYDGLHNQLKWCRAKGVDPGALLRSYLRIAREELGEEVFVLACWGVLPEVIGLADACRIGGDGYGPVTLQQYNSWNGVVWRNDPDHCDVAPRNRVDESLLRPALASIAGAVLMLSDRPEIYAEDKYLRGLRRSSPVLFSHPGQLYDFDSRKTEHLKKHPRTDIRSGARPSPIDGDQFGEVCPYWLNEFVMPYEHWYVLHRLNWSEEQMPAARVSFAALGLEPEQENLVYEFWNHRAYGVLQGEIALPELPAFGLESLAIRAKQPHPQLISSNRHLCQGAAEIETMHWDGASLKGRSKVVVGDEYRLTFYVPKAYTLCATSIGADAAENTTQKGNLLEMSFVPTQTASVAWSVSFRFD